MRIIVLALSILIMFSGCAESGNLSSSIDMSGATMDYTKEDVFEFVKANKKDLTRMAKLLSEYDFRVYFRSDDDGKLYATTDPITYRGEILRNEKLMALAEKFIDEKFIDEIRGGFTFNTNEFVCVIDLNLGRNSNRQFHWLDYWDVDVASSGEKIVGNWYYNAAYPT